MPSGPELRPALTAVVLRALVYALAITALVLYAPSTEHVFIYQGF
jgi:hypothetical protein